MLAVRKTGAWPGIDLADVPEPVPAPGEVLIEVAAAGICGTDVHIDHWSEGYRHIAAALPVTLGHEFAGRVVVPAQDGSGPPAGARVTVVPATTCGHCPACRAGDFNACPERRGIGILRDGAFARHVAVPARNCAALPDGLADEVAALAEPMAVAAGAVATGDVRAGMRVLVFGPGTIGQGIALFAERAGAAVTVVGRDDAARFRTLRALGFDDLTDLADADGAADLRARTGQGFDRVFEATGVAAAFAAGFGALASGGILTVVGIHPRPAPVDLTSLVRRRWQIRGAFSSPAAIWPEVIAAIAAAPARFARLITHRLPLAEALAGFALAERRESSKVILIPS